MPEILLFPAKEEFEKLAPNVYARKLQDTPSAAEQLENLRREVAMYEMPPCDTQW